MATVVENGPTSPFGIQEDRTMSLQKEVETTAVQPPETQVSERAPYHEHTALGGHDVADTASLNSSRTEASVPAIPLRRKPVPQASAAPSVEPLPGKSTEEADLEEELEIIELLEKKAAAGVAAGQYDIAERVLSKVLRRYQQLAIQRPTVGYISELVSTHMQIADSLDKQEKYEQALASLRVAAEIAPSDQIEARRIEVLTHMKDYAGAMELATSTLTSRRNLYGKEDVRYHEILALKIRILLLQDEFDEAEAYYKTLPETSRHRTDLTYYFDGQQAAAPPPTFDSTHLASPPPALQRTLSTISTSVPPPNYSTTTPNQSGAQHAIDFGTTEASTQLTAADFELPYNRPKIEKLAGVAQTGSINDLQQILDRYDDSKRWYSSVVSGHDTLFHIAARHGNTRVIKRLLETNYIVYISARNDAHHTPLHAATTRGHEDIVRLLLENGADVAAVTKWRWTPLHEAATIGHARICKLLLDHGANVEARTDWDWTPLHKAVESNRDGAARLLLQMGANIEATCIDAGFVRKSRKTTYQIASTRSMKTLLKEFGTPGSTMSRISSHLNPIV